MNFFSRQKQQSEAIHRLYREHGPGLLVYACSVVGYKHIAEDVLQEVFLKLLQRDYVPDEPKPYLYKAVQHAALNALRANRKTTALTGTEPWFAAPHGDYLAEAALQSGLQQLPLDQREVLVLHLWGGLSFAEIGAVLSISHNTAASRHRYALQKLRAMLQPRTCPHADERP